ncbi:MAG: hypothetical protein RIQ60_3595 [Pseudomonadota bacterium]|jgi:hypothetical protein
MDRLQRNVPLSAALDVSQQLVNAARSGATTGAGMLRQAGGLDSVEKAIQAMQQALSAGSSADVLRSLRSARADLYRAEIRMCNTKS